MGMVNLDSIDFVIDANRRNYEVYSEEFEKLPGISLLDFDKFERQNFQYIVVEVDEECALSRDSIIEALHAENVRARRYFWPGCHKMLPYRSLYPQADSQLPWTQLVADRVIVLPTGPTMDEGMVRVVASIIAALTEDKG
jgi:dTDP-4-amino-4,6-dideoxygalactose transaminase